MNFLCQEVMVDDRSIRKKLHLTIFYTKRWPLTTFPNEKVIVDDISVKKNSSLKAFPEQKLVVDDCSSRKPFCPLFFSTRKVHRLQLDDDKQRYLLLFKNILMKDVPNPLIYI